MPIQCKCQCGKEYTFKEQFAGRRAKCPACGGVVQIPGLRATGVSVPKPADRGAPPYEEEQENKTLIHAGLGATALILAAGLGIAIYFFVRPVTTVTKPGPDKPLAEAVVQATGSDKAPVPTKDTTGGDSGGAAQPGPATAHSAPDDATVLSRIRTPEGIKAKYIQRGPGEQWMGESYSNGKTTPIVQKKEPKSPEYAQWMLLCVELHFDKDTTGVWTFKTSQCRLVNREKPLAKYACLSLVRPSISENGGSSWSVLSGQVKHCIGGRPFASYNLMAGPYGGPPTGSVEVQDYRYDEIGLDSPKRGFKLEVLLAFAPDTPFGEQLELQVDPWSAFSGAGTSVPTVPAKAR